MILCWKTSSVVTAVLLAAACAPKPELDESAAPQDVALPDSIVLERTVCFGTCPAYRLRIAGNGAVLFEPRIPAGSPTSDKIPVERVRSLAAALERADFNAFPDVIQQDRVYCAMEATDNPSAIIRVFRGAASKTVNHYFGCHANDERAQQRLEVLRALPAQIDSAADAARWIKPVELR